MAYAPIENYGVIGNLRTAALVGLDGSIDWLCLPNFDSPSVFAAILDDRKGGRFQIVPTEEECRRKQYYWPETNVLVTRFYHSGGVAELIDFMPIGRAEIIRHVKVTRGRMAFDLTCSPAFDYARARHEATRCSGGVAFDSNGTRLVLTGSEEIGIRDGTAVSRFELEAGSDAAFLLRQPNKDERDDRPCPTCREMDDVFHETICYWRHWLGKCTYTGRWREMVHRSALALKLLTFEPTGAIVAAPTCSLPEMIGGTRNWDYRYSWIRDSAFTVYGLVRIGFTEEANAFMSWLERLPENDDGTPPLQVVYRIDGGSELPEETLGHLEGYRGSAPVRIGNGAANQLQLDIFGEKADAVYLANKHAAPLSATSWARGRKMINWLVENWNRPDEGIWETRAGQQHFTYSKLMCWVALDRALRLADKRSFPAERAKWLATRDEIYETIMREGWSEKRQAFTQSFGSEVLDASVLIMPLVFFNSANEPRMISTIDAIMQQVTEGGLRADGLIHRYDPKVAPDGFAENEGTFNLCTFWLVEALTRAGRTDPGRLEEARLMFERMLGYGNHLGLYSEQTGFAGEALGNYPQAFTHLSLISAAFNLDRELSRR